VQVDPITPTLKPPGSMPLKLRYDGLLSKVASSFNLRRSIEELLESAPESLRQLLARMGHGQGLSLVPVSAQLELLCPPYNPKKLMNVSWSCSS
jgi:hypothetical protein